MKKESAVSNVIVVCTSLRFVFDAKPPLVGFASFKIIVNGFNINLSGCGVFTDSSGLSVAMPSTKIAGEYKPVVSFKGEYRPTIARLMAESAQVAFDQEIAILNSRFDESEASRAKDEPQDHYASRYYTEVSAEPTTRTDLTAVIRQEATR